MDWTIRTLALVGAGLSLGGAAPRALAPAAGGLWEIGKSAQGAGARRMCIADPVILSQWEHRGGRCTRIIIADEGNKTIIHYTCSDGGFGRSEMTLVTPRTLRVATQGITRGDGPFNYVLHARRVGNCPPR